jgi:phage tail sheath protein FI
MDTTAERYIEALVNHVKTGSKFISVEDLDIAGTTQYRRPANGTFGPLTGGDDGLVGLVDLDFIGSAAGPTGFRVFDPYEDISIMACPDRPTSWVHNQLITLCEDTRDGSCFAVLDPPEDQSATEIVTYVTTTASIYDLTEFAAIYWPWVKVINPNQTVFGTGDDITIPPSGHICGAYARTDGLEGGVHKSPAGIDENKGFLRGVVGFETEETLDSRKRDLVYPKNINPLNTGPTPYIDGSRVLKTTSNFPSIGERRGVIFIEQTIVRGIEFSRHVNITPKLRRRIEAVINFFLLQRFNLGAFRGDRPANSFFVDIGPGLNPPSEQFAKKTNIRIGLATAKPNEFNIIRVTQDTRELETQLAAAGLL